MLEGIIFIDELIKKDEYRIKAIYKGDTTCTACIKLSKNLLTLNWIETNPINQHKGIGSLMLNYLCDKAETKYCDFKITIVEEYLLNNFYFKWFSKRVDKDGEDPDAVNDKFSQLVDDSDVVKFKLTIPLQELNWTVANACSTPRI